MAKPSTDIIKTFEEGEVPIISSPPVKELPEDPAELKIVSKSLNENVVNLDKENDNLRAEITRLNNTLSEFQNSLIALSSDNTNLKAENDSLKQEINTLNTSITNKDSVISSQNQTIEKLKSPYANELELIREYNDLVTRIGLSNDYSRKIIESLNIDKGLDLLLSNLNFYIIDKIVQDYAIRMDEVASIVNNKNQSDSLRFNLVDTILTAVNQNNIQVKLISKNAITNLENIDLSQIGNTDYFTISIDPEVLPKFENQFLLMFTNSNFLIKDQKIRFFKFSESMDVVYFKSGLTDPTLNHKMILKTNNSPVQSSVIYHEIQSGEYKILFIDKIRNVVPETCDILYREIDEFMLPVTVVKSDLDDIKQILIGKRTFTISESEYIYFQDDDETVLKVVREYLDPQLGQNIRIPTNE